MFDEPSGGKGLPGNDGSVPEAISSTRVGKGKGSSLMQDILKNKLAAINPTTKICDKKCRILPFPQGWLILNSMMDLPINVLQYTFLDFPAP